MISSHKLFSKICRHNMLFGFCTKKPNYYEILDVSINAKNTEIKSKYYSLVKKYHPDVSQTNS